MWQHMFCVSVMRDVWRCELQLTIFAAVLLYPIDIDATMRHKMCRISCKALHSSGMFRIAYIMLH